MPSKVLHRFRTEWRRLKGRGLVDYLRLVKPRLGVWYARNLLRRRVVLGKLHGFKIYLDLDDHGISRTLAVVGTREQDQIAILKRELREGMVVLDIGSNVGSYALLAASLVGESGRVFAVEPAPQTFELLAKTVGLNRLSHIIETLPVGMSNRTGTAKLYVHEKANLHTLNAAKYHDYRNQPKYADTLEIDVMSIGDFIRDHEPIDFVRMDIEGHEVEILEGLGAAIPQYHCSPRVLFENHFPKYDDAHHSMREPLSNLFSLGYYAKTMVSNDEATARFKDMGYQPLTVIKTDGVFRGLYEGVSKNDALTLICDIGTVRATLIERAGVPAQ